MFYNSSICIFIIIVIVVCVKSYIEIIDTSKKASNEIVIHGNISNINTS